MGAKSRRKGKVGERAACELLRPLFPNVRRRINQGRGGSEGADLDNTPGWHVEVGVGAVHPATKWRQAEADAQESRLDMDGKPTLPCDEPIAITKRDREPWLVTMEAGAWMELARKARQWDAEWDRIDAIGKRALQGAEAKAEAKEEPDAQGDGVTRNDDGSYTVTGRLDPEQQADLLSRIKRRMGVE